MPIPADLDADLMEIRIGQRLGIPAMAVSRVPLHYVRAATIEMKVESLEAERQRKRIESQRKKAATARTSRRRQ